MRFLPILCVLLFLPFPAYAQCTNPAGNVGEIIYNDDHGVIQGCGTNGWVAFHAPGPDCPNIGDQCQDGTISAGDFMGQKRYITPTNTDHTYWKTSNGVDDIAIDSDTDGRANSDQVPNSTVFPAFKNCKDLSFGGHTDWYLPAQDELSHLYTNKVVLEAGPMADFPLGNSYCSSTEANASFSWKIWLEDGSQAGSWKASGSCVVRCMRR